MSSDDRLSISFERQEAVEDGEEEEMKEEKEEEEEEEKNEKVVQLWSPEKLRRDYITSDPSATCGPSGKVTGSEGHVSNNININDPTSTLGPSRNPTDPSASGVTAEPITPIDVCVHSREHGSGARKDSKRSVTPKLNMTPTTMCQGSSLVMRAWSAT